MIEEKLKELINAKYGNIKEFSRIIDLPYTTVDSILKRGIKKANVQNIITICNELDIDVESLSSGSITFKNNSRGDNTDSISTDKPNVVVFQQGKILKYDDLPEEGQKELESYIEYLRQKYKKEV